MLVASTKKEEAEQAKKDFESKRLEMEEKFRWEEEKQKKPNLMLRKKIRQRYEDRFDAKRSFNKTLEELMATRMPQDHEARSGEKRRDFWQ